MKLRFKVNDRAFSITLDDNCTLGEAKSSIQDESNGAVGRSFCLSLNKKDALEGDEVPLKDLGVISGDIIHVLSPDQAGKDPQQSTGIGQLRISGNLPETGTSVLVSNEQPTNKRKDATKQGSRFQRRDNERCFEEPVPGPSRDGASNEPDAMDSEEIQVDPIVVQRCLSEPMLCRECSDGQVTSLLNEMFIRSECRTAEEALCIAFHVLMLETGFCTIKSKDSSGSDGGVPSLDVMPDDWRQRAPSCYALSYSHPSCEEDGVFTLTCVPLGKVIIVHGAAKVAAEKEDRCQLQIPMSDFVSSHYTDASQCYRNLPKLSRIFKDTIILALLQKYRDLKDLPPMYGLLGLSHEIKLRILSFLDVVTLLKVSETCKDLYTVCQDRYIWRRLYLTHFGNRYDNSLAQDWFKMYKLEYQRRKRKRKFMNESTILIPPSFIPPDPYAPFAPPPFPLGTGIIGGDYDLNPQFPGVPHPLNRRLRQPDPMNPLLRPRFDPIGPLPDHRIRPGRGGGFRDFRGPKFF